MEKMFADALLEILRKLSPIEFVRAVRGSKVRQLKEALECSTLSPCARELIEEELNFLLVRETTGIVGGKMKREKIVELIHKGRGELLIGLVARASPNLKMECGKLVSALEAKDYKWSEFVNMLSGLVSAIGIAIVISPAVLKIAGLDVGLSNALLVFGLGIVVMGFGLVLLSGVAGIRATQQVTDLLTKLQTDTSAQADR